MQKYLHTRQVYSKIKFCEMMNERIDTAEHETLYMVLS